MPAATALDRARLGTRLAFLVAGFGVSCWAPLVPFAKVRLGVDDRVIGLLILSLGLGSVSAMTLIGRFSARYGTKPVIVGGCAGLIVVLPLLSVIGTAPWLSAALFVFGAALGSLDVAMNVHAVEVEKAVGRPLMSGFHALYSIGGFAGSLTMTLLLSTRATLLESTATCSLLMAGATWIAAPTFLEQRAAAGSSLSIVPRGIVLVLAILAAISFLSEGAVLDWGALLLTGMSLVDVAHGGVGYVLFSIAMTLGRLSGDSIVTRFGDRAVLFYGGLMAIAGYLSVVVLPVLPLASIGFLLIGLGAANVVPVLFRRAGSQQVMPVNLAVSAISTVGYAGVLLGPAAIGFLAQATSLRLAFGTLALLFCAIPLLARSVTAPR